jgi:transcriptional regulator with XRE-family HTH domain
MTMKDFLEWWATESDDHARLLAEERLIADVTESLWEVMESANVSKTELATRLGKSKGHVSQLFSGSRNMTLRTLAEICFALDRVATIHISSPRIESNWHTARGAVPATPVGRVRYTRTGNVCEPLGRWKTAA